MEEQQVLKNYVKEVLEYLDNNNLPHSLANINFYFNELQNYKNDKTKIILQKFNDNHISLGTEIYDNLFQLNQGLKQGFLNVRHIHKISKQVEETNKKVIAIIDDKYIQKMELFQTLHKFQHYLLKYTNEIRKVEKNIGIVLNKINNYSIFEEDYNTYHLNYIEKVLKKEKDLMKTHGYETSILFIQINNIELNEHKKQKFFNSFLKKVLHQQARTSDYIGYLGNNIFTIVLIQTPMKDAKKAKIRLSKVFEENTIFVDEKETKLEVLIIENSIEEINNFNEIIFQKQEEFNKLKHINTKK